MRRALAVIAIALVLVGCSGPDPVASDATIQLSRDGGDMQIHDRLEVRPDGSWTYTNTAGKQFRGTLAQDQRQAAYGIVTSAEFARELVKPTDDMACADAPTLKLTAGGRTSTYFGCFEEQWPKTAALVDLLQRQIINDHER
jgi:hypothetical protein